MKSCNRVWSLLITMVLVCSKVGGQGSSSQFVYVCEHESLEFTEGMVLIAPGFSYNPGLIQANCNLTVYADAGLKLLVQIYQRFTIENCGYDFVWLSDGSNTVSKCGIVTSYQQIFATNSNMLNIWYKSDSRRDQIALSLTEFGCAEPDIIIGGHYTSSQALFTQFTSLYTTVITCDEGYLLNGTNTSSVSVTCEKSQRDSVYSWQSQLNYQCKLGECGSLPPVTHGSISVSSLNVGSTATYSCDVGYQLVGPLSRSCSVAPQQGASWDAYPPTCKIHECGRLIIPNANFTSPMTTTFDTRVQFYCLEGYISGDTENEAKCGGDSLWQFEPCEVIVDTCISQLPSSYAVSEILSATQFRVSCGDNSSEAVIECLDDNKWSGQLPKCQEIVTEKQIGLESDSLVVIGVCVAVTLLVILIIIVVTIIMVKKKQSMSPMRKSKVDDPALSSDPGYAVVHHGQSNKGQSSLSVSPERIPHPQNNKDIYAQVNKLREPDSNSRPGPLITKNGLLRRQQQLQGSDRDRGDLQMIDNELYASNGGPSKPPRQKPYYGW